MSGEAANSAIVDRSRPLAHGIGSESAVGARLHEGYYAPIGSHPRPEYGSDDGDGDEAPTSRAPPDASRPSLFGRLWSGLRQRLTNRRRKRTQLHGAAVAASDDGNSDEGNNGASGGNSRRIEGDDEAAVARSKHLHSYRATLDAVLDEEEDMERTNFATIDLGRQDERDLLGYHAIHEPLRLPPVPQLQSGGRGCMGVLAGHLARSGRLFVRLLAQGLRASQGWVVCGLAGALTGLAASMIDMCVHWAMDFRMGVCADNMWLSNKVCCASVAPDNYSPDRDNSALEQVCPLWRNWDVILNHWGLPTALMSDYVSMYAVYIFWSCVMALLSCFLVTSLSRFSASGGIPEIKTILGGAAVKHVLSPLTLLVKCVSLILSVSSGLSVGKEGPFVHIGACSANLMCKLFRRYRENPAKSNAMVSAGCAAGVAVAFGAPIGGILYSLEEVSTYFGQKVMWRSFFCATIASLAVQFIDPFQEGKLVQFQITYTKAWNWFEMVPFVLLGVMGGLAGAFFIAGNSFVNRWRKTTFLSTMPFIEVAVVAMITALIKFQSSFTRGNVTSLLEALFEDCSHAPAEDPLNMCDVDNVGSTMTSLFFTTMVTLLLTTYSVGLSVPAGLLVPSLTTGAAMGRLVGTGMRWLQMSTPSWGVWHPCRQGDPNCITPGIYAIVGGAAVLGGVTRMTIALAVIMSEITGGLTYLLPIMIAVMTSKLVGDLFGEESVYERSIHSMHYPFLDVKREIPHTLLVESAMTPGSDLIMLSQRGHTVASLQATLRTTRALSISGMPVITNMVDRHVIGYISRADLLQGLKVAARERAPQSITTLNLPSPSASSPRPAAGERRQSRSFDSARRLHPDYDDFAVTFSATPCSFVPVPPDQRSSIIDLSHLLDPAPVQVNESMALYRLHDMFCKLGLRYCIVVRFGRIVGICTKKDVVDYLHQIDQQRHQHQL